MNAEVNLELFQSNHNKITSIVVADRFSAIEAASFPEHFKDICIHKNKPNKIILDFSKTKFIDSSGIGALVKSIKLANEYGIKLIVSKTSNQVQAVLKMTGLESILFLKPQESQTDNLNLPETHPSVNSKTKRMIDFVGSIVGLFITSILFIPIAIAIKVESKGPILFSQTRQGWLGSQFKIYKFRTMSTDAEARKDEVKNEANGAIFKCSFDPRITKVGQFLRKTSLDELPQFWNVLQSSMSLVGTRPPTPDEIEQYNIPHWQRLDVKPGITGEWQVNGRSSVKSFEDIIQLDLDYQSKWSLLYDIKLILKTIILIFSKDSGAM
ncbi:MAG: sugar transferase [Thiohalomonas sp.]|nr:sugar transferase [Thiohalomonas sp.]